MLYQPPPTVEKFMRDEAHRIRVLVGPLGSGKTMGCIMELLRRACEQTPYNGVRYTRFACIRNTLQQLRQTVLADTLQYLQHCAHYFVTDSTLQVRLALPDGTRVHSDWMLLPLDTKEDVRRLLSLQLTGAWINEVREVPFEIIRPLLGRCGRYPSKAMGGATWRGIICDTNPWDTDSKYHERMVLDPRPAWALYHQPSGLSPGAENVANLPEGYYAELMEDQELDWAAVHVESQWGTSNAGQAVFRRTFHAPTHVKDMRISVNPNKPIMVGLDFGRTPCAIIGQHDNFGRAIIMKEVVTEGMGLIQMVEEHLKPVLFSQPFAGKRVFIVGDPAGRFKSQIDEETPFDVLKTLGFMAYPASTNSIDPRLLAVERLLRQTIMGEPGLQISRAGCPTLIRAMGDRYRYRRRRDGQFDDLPEKLHPWSDVCFVAGTLISTPGGLKNIEDLRVGDVVTVGSTTRRLGVGRVEATGSRVVETTIELTLTGGRTIRCTPEHPFMLDGWQPAYTLRQGDVLEGIECRNSRSSSESATTVVAKINTSGESTTRRVENRRPCTAQSGRTTTARFLMGFTSIIVTAIQRTTTSVISRWSTNPYTPAVTSPSAMSPHQPNTHVPAPQSGIAVSKGVPGIANTVPAPGTTRHRISLSARTAVGSTRLTPGHVSADFARRAARRLQGILAALTMKNELAPSAASYSTPTDTTNQVDAAPVVAAVKWLQENVTVYNLQVDAGVYYANGVLVSNCDALQYFCLGTQANLTGRVMKRDRPHLAAGREPVSAAGWT